MSLRDRLMPDDLTGDERVQRPETISRIACRAYFQGITFEEGTAFLAKHRNAPIIYTKAGRMLYADYWPEFAPED